MTEYSFKGATPYRPPAPFPKQMLSLFDGELLSMLPLASYEQTVLSVRKGKRPVILVNDPELIITILSEKAELFAKSEVRTHVSLGKDAPCSRPIERFGDIVAYPILGGLHHR